jgi:protein associated with RNAse G/E
MSGITVIKRDDGGQETWRYEGKLLKREPKRVVLEARFNRPDMPFQEIVLKTGDLFVETFYTERWYNIFEIHDRDSRQLKGWYCNVGRPAVLDGDSLSYDDLALDLWVDTQGRQTVLDEDEFEALELDEETRRRALAALAELQTRFKEKRSP